MRIPISQSDAVEMFDLPVTYLYVCDGKKECGKPSCTDYMRRDVCHHTADIAHSLYPLHLITEFERHPAISDDAQAAIICVEPIRG